MSWRSDSESERPLLRMSNTVFRRVKSRDGPAVLPLLTPLMRMRIRRAGDHGRLLPLRQPGVEWACRSSA